MIKSDFSQSMPDVPGRVHFVGIGGAGMSGVAHLFLHAGIAVSGSDLHDSAAVAALRAKGVPVTIGHERSAVDGADTLVVTGAIDERNPEYVAARERAVPIVHRAVALAWLARNRRLVAVAGAHGKTTSTAMIVTALHSLGVDPGFVNGGVLRSLGVSARAGEDDLFVVEADESDGSFLLYRTAFTLITNVDPDHLDHFGTEQAFKDAFVAFARGAREGVVISADDAGAAAIAPRLSDRHVTTFGEHPTAAVRVHSVELGPTVAFQIAWEGHDYALSLRVPGLHNALNCAGAFGVLVGLGFDPQRSADALSDFEGTQRRFELAGDVGGVRVYDDFAHHPTEVRAALTGARAAVAGGRLIPIFQPHLFSRTRLMADEFADTFESLADHTIVVPIYPAREPCEPGVSGALITQRFADATRAEYVEDWSQAAARAAELASPGDIVMPMGGGDIYRIIPAVLDALARKHSESS